MKRVLIAVAAALVMALGGVAAVAADPGKGNGPPATVPGSPGDDCSHGNADKPCRPDPQPEHGKDCDDHGNARGNEDHCGPTDTTPTDTTPTDTTPTDTTPTTPVETTPVETTPEVTPSSPDATDTGTTTSSGTASPAPVVAPSTTGPSTAPSAPSLPKPAAKAKAKVTVVKVQKKAHGVVVVTTADGRKHVGVMGSG